MIRQMLLIIALLILSVSTQVFAQQRDNFFSNPNRNDQPLFNGEQNRRDRIERERQDDQRRHTESLERENRRLRAIRAQERNRRQIDRGSGIFVPRRSR